MAETVTNTGKLAYTVNGAAKISGIGQKALRRLIAEGQIKVLRIGVKALIPAWALEQYIKDAAA